MRIGVRLRSGREAADAAAAEAHGAFGVLVEPERGATVAVAGAAAASTTTVTRLVVRMPLGLDHPVTLAEDLAVLDNVSGGRVVALLDTSALDVEAAVEDVSLLVASLSPRPVRHAGARWQVPAGLEAHEAPARVQVTPEPVQVVVPVWLVGTGAAEVGHRTGHPVTASGLDDVDDRRPVQPALDRLGGDLEVDRERVVDWADAGATHLLVGGDDLDALMPVVARYLAPEVAMPQFPRVVAEALTPLPWPGPARHVSWPA